MEMIGYAIVGIIFVLVVIGGVSKGIEDQKQREFNRQERERITGERASAIAPDR